MATSNPTKSGLPDAQPFLLIVDKTDFDARFGSAFVPGGKKTYLPKDEFDKHVVIATIKRGTTAFTYKVEQVVLDGKTLSVQYSAKAEGTGGSARFASPLIISVPKGEYDSVKFIENGKEAGVAKTGK